MSRIFSKKKQRANKARRGSILLTVMGLLGVLIVLTGAMITIAGSVATRAYRYGREVRLRWMAEGELDALIARLENGREFLKEKKYTVKTEAGRIDVSVTRSDDQGRAYTITATARVRGDERSSLRGVEAFYPSDHTLTVETNWSVFSRHYPAAVIGPVYVNGDCTLAAADKGGLELTGDFARKQPLWTVFGFFRAVSADGKEPITLFRSRVNPDSVGNPWTRPGNIYVLAGSNAAAYVSGTVPDLTDRMTGRPFRFPEFSRLFSTLTAMTEPLFRHMSGERSTLPEFPFVNSKILEKDLIAVGDGNRFIFDYKPTERPIENVYMRRVKDGQPLDTIRIDPVADADSIGIRFFNARMGKLYLAAGGSKLYLQFDKDSLKELGRIYYGTMHRSYCSVDHPFSKFYIENLSEMQKYQEGSDYRIDYAGKYIEFLNQDLISSYYSFLPEVGDGQRLGFSLPLTFQYQYVYVNGKMVDNVQREGETLMFAVPPPQDARIGFLTRVPKVFGRRDVPAAGVGIFADKLVAALKIDLGEMQHYPPKGVIVSDRPLYVTGNAAYPVTIASSSDIYIDKINATAADPRAVGIVSGKAVWVYNEEMKTNVNRRVFIHSQADRVYTTHSGRPGSEGSAGSANRNAIIYGSVLLAGRLENTYVSYPKGIYRPEAHVFSTEPFFSVQYRYDPYFADPKNLPPGINPLVRLLWWRR